MQRLIVWAREQQGVFMQPRSPIPSAASEARPETMIAFLEAVRARTGGGDGLLASLGFDSGAADRVRDLLLEPA